MLFYTILNHQKGCCSCQLNRSMLSLFIHTSSTCASSHSAFPLNFTATITWWKQAWRIQSRNVILVLLCAVWRRSPLKNWSPTSTQKTGIKIFPLLCSFIHSLQLFISTTTQLPRRASLQRLELQTATYRLNMAVLLKKGKLILMVSMAYFTVYLIPHWRSPGPPPLLKHACVTDDEPEKCPEAGVAVGYYLAGSCWPTDGSWGLLHCHSPFWEGPGKRSLCCQAAPSAGTVPPTALARPLGIP